MNLNLPVNTVRLYIYKYSSPYVHWRHWPRGKLNVIIGCRVCVHVWSLESESRSVVYLCFRDGPRSSLRLGAFLIRLWDGGRVKKKKKNLQRPSERKWKRNDTGKCQVPDPWRGFSSNPIPYSTSIRNPEQGKDNYLNPVVYTTHLHIQFCLRLIMR